MYHIPLVLQDIKIGLFKIIEGLGYTIEAGIGENPLPISQFDEIYGDNVGILVLRCCFVGAQSCAPTNMIYIPSGKTSFLSGSLI